jgi:S-DNA-T family DNA segregation ATPase FtsK/SpoIIIE
MAHHAKGKQTMASRASAKAPSVDWRAAFRRSARRALQLAGAVILFSGMVFLALALISYSHTDPSLSTAANGPVANWMGRAGAFAAERALFLFGWVCVLLLPLFYALARKLWRDADGDETPHGLRWWRAVALLLLAMMLLATVMALVIDRPEMDLPAGLGGIAGLLGKGAIEALAGRLPVAAQGWTILGAGVACLLAGAVLGGFSPSTGRN